MPGGCAVKAGSGFRLRKLQAHTLDRFEHEVIRPNATHDVTADADTPAGKRLAEVLGSAKEDGVEVAPRFRTEVRRTARTIHARGAVVEVALDEGRLLANDASVRVCELEFELVSGLATAMLALAERWRMRFGLVYDPRSEAERGERLVTGSKFPPIRKASRVKYAKDAVAIDAFGAVLDECLAHITRNAIGLCDGAPDQRVEHVHQMRVGVRRLRSALRSFDGWVPAPPAPVVEGIKALFEVLGMWRDSDVLEGGVAAELAKAAPALPRRAQGKGADAVETVRSCDTQQLCSGGLPGGPR